MNAAIFARVGLDAELKYTQSGRAVASFSLAVDQGKDSDGEKRNPLWIKCTLWEKRAEDLAQYITKGKMLVVAGLSPLRRGFPSKMTQLKPAIRLQRWPMEWFMSDRTMARSTPSG